MTSEEMNDRIHALYYEAERLKTLRLGISSFEWEIGMDVFDKLVNNMPPIIHHGLEVEYTTLMGIPVRYDVENPNKLKLWMEV